MPRKNYLTIQLEREGERTNIYSVINDDGQDIGTIKWHGAWRGYVFFPASNTIWSIGCLHEVTTFIAEIMAERRLRLDNERLARAVGNG